jgi:outer membrane receptor protein involved in Fe transport
LLAATAPAAFAQQQTPAPTDGADTLEAVVVTGTRIQRDPNATAPLPISSISVDDLRASGANDTTAALRQIPALVSSSTVADSIERGPANTIGQATLNLRQLGSNRTLVLVDGYRHVSGVAGSQAVDVSTIPSALIERVDVMTGGASAVYGADAVAGVVNYILRRDLEGLEFGFQPGVSSEGDGESYRLEATWGRNFADGRGNLTVSAGFTDEAEVLLGDREFTANNGRANNSTTYSHPDRRFQKGDVNPAKMPNFAARFRLGGPGPASTRFPYGVAIPTSAQATTLWPGGLTAAEQALIQRAANAPLFKIARDPRFGISSGAGLIFRADFRQFTTDLNGNGIPDCQDSFIGRFGFGGGGAVERTNQNSLIPGSERFYTNIRGRWEFSESVEAFADAKFARNQAVSRNSYNTFYDTLRIFPDNPFIPAALRAESNAAGGLRVSRDMLDLGDNERTADRRTFRLVTGLRGDPGSHLRYEVAANIGRTDTEDTNANSVLYDRLFAAIDVIAGPGGRPICRSDVSNVPHPGSEEFPRIRPGFFTFRPGDGQCRPANILAGEQSVRADAVAFITTPTTDEFQLDQRVLTVAFNGDTGAFFSLPGGPVQFAAGAEYREEESESIFDPLDRGLLPANSPAGPAGTFIGDISLNQSLVFDAQTRTFNSGGKFDVKEVFAEVSIPLVKDVPFVRELSRRRHSAGFRGPADRAVLRHQRRQPGARGGAGQDLHHRCGDPAALGARPQPLVRLLLDRDRGRDRRGLGAGHRQRLLRAPDVPEPVLRAVRAQPDRRTDLQGLPVPAPDAAELRAHRDLRRRLRRRLPLRPRRQCVHDRDGGELVREAEPLLRPGPHPVREPGPAGTGRAEVVRPRVARLRARPAVAAVPDAVPRRAGCRERGADRAGRARIRRGRHGGRVHRPRVVRQLRVEPVHVLRGREQPHEREAVPRELRLPGQRHGSLLLRRGEGAALSA